MEEEEGGAKEGEHNEETQNRGLKPKKARSREQGTACGKRQGHRLQNIHFTVIGDNT